MSGINQILSGLQKARRIGDGKYVACCPVHGDKNPSLAITQKSDGGTLIHCFGCGANGIDVCNALGVDPSALFPPSDSQRYDRQTRQGFSARQLLQALQKDLLVVLIATNRYLLEGERPCQSDVDYLINACKRINEALTYLEGAGT